LILLLLIAEFGFVHTYTLNHLSLDGGKPIGITEFIQSTTISRTEEYGYGPSHLRTENRGTRNCYEPSFMGPKVEKTGAPDYHGEAYLTQGRGSVALLGYTPGRIEADYSSQIPATIAFNTRVLAGWSALSPAGATVHPVGSLLGVDVPAGTGSVVLEYTPHYLRLTLAFFLLGIALLVWAWREVKKRGEGENSPSPSS
jgi:hypothetical protein